MAKPSDLTKEVLAVAEEGLVHERSEDNRRETENQLRRQQALSLRLSGFTYEEIGRHLGITPSGASDLIKRTLERSTNLQIKEMRELENARLDKAQAAIWQDVLKGDKAAIDTFLRISRQRAQINGLYAPTKLDMTVSLKSEMEQALNSLEALVLQGGDVINGEVVDDDDA